MTHIRTDSCDCCQGTEAITPLRIANRPGLSTLRYRAGTHGAFLETMMARASIIRNAAGNNLLTTRDADDASIAMFDAWATVGDVLTFYQEHIANEGYLRTATERRSVLELARLVGYGLRPGVAASVWLAVELEKGHTVTIEPGQLRAQNIPGPGELPQTFENIERFEARATWNALQARLTRPQRKPATSTLGFERLYLKGINTNLREGDPLLISREGCNAAALSGADLYRVTAVVPDASKDRTAVSVQTWLPNASQVPITGIAAAAASTSATVAEGALAVIARVAAEHARAKRVPEMRQRVSSYLGQLKAHIASGADADSVTAFIEQKTLDQIEGELRVAKMNPRMGRMSEWLANLLDELRASAIRDFGVEPLSPREIALWHSRGSNSGGGAYGYGNGDEGGDELIEVLPMLTRPGSIPPRNTLSLDRDLRGVFGLLQPGLDASQPRSRDSQNDDLVISVNDVGRQVVGAFEPRIASAMARAMENQAASHAPQLCVYAFRAKAAPFGHNAPLRAQIKQTPEYAGEIATRTVDTNTTYQEWQLNDPLGTGNSQSHPHQDHSTLFLDGEYLIQPASYLLIIPPSESPIIEKLAANIQQTSIGAYGLSGKSTLISTSINWIDTSNIAAFSIMRGTRVFAQSEPLELAEVPIDEPIVGGTDQLIELDALYEDLQSGRWIVVRGERADVPGVTGVIGSELVMLGSVVHGYFRSLPGDRRHTFIQLAKKLEYAYKRDTVTFNANVVKATHGETRNEVLGAGDASKAFQSFTLKQPPLTYLSSPTPAGAESTLEVFVNDVRWRETDSLDDKGKADRVYLTRTNDEGKTRIVFGDGMRGARLPTGLENIRARYRNGIGRPGNVSADAISLLMARPLGVKAVNNPMRSGGGADKESRDQARRNAPLTVTALDRLVSVRDYADFAVTFAGIGKASAALLSDGHAQRVHVTVAGADDIAIDPSDDLFRNLRQALHDFGDPFMPITLAVRELVMLVLSADVRILPDYQWEPVALAVRNSLYAAFGFERRELGQNAHLSEVIAAIQSVPGVAYVDVDTFGAVEEKKSVSGQRQLRTPKEVAEAAAAVINTQTNSGPMPNIAKVLHATRRTLSADSIAGVIQPATLIILPRSVPDVLVINQPR